MRIRVPKEALVVAATVLAVVIPSSRPAYTWLRRISADKQLNIRDGLANPESSTDPQVLLAEANRLYWLNNGPKAAPVYAKAESLFASRGDARNELYAKIGHLRSEAETMSFVDLSRFLSDQLQNPIMRSEPFQAQLPQVQEILRKLAGKLDIKNADERRLIKTRQAVLHSEEFQALWNRIKHKTTYRVQFDNEKLVTECAKAIGECPPITKTRVQIRKADLAIGRGGVSSEETTVAAPIIIEETDIELPDLLTDLQDKTQLTRRSLVRILTDSVRLDDFKRHPQQFIELATEFINRTKRLALVDGIKYQRIGDEHYYAQELFEQEELTGYLRNMLAATKSVYEEVVYDSATVEKTFAEQLEKNEAVKVYAKLPGWFKVPTPLGTYNPDWAVLVEKDGAERLYFVVETKSSLFTDELRDKESAKIQCGKAHFKALAVGESPAQFIQARNIDDLMAHG